MKTTVDIHLILILMGIVIKVKTIVDDIAEKMPDQFNMHDIMAKCEERTPYIIVCFQVRHSHHAHIVGAPSISNSSWSIKIHISFTLEN